MMTQCTRWLVAYDIRDGKRLAKVARIMEDFGVRVQESVFEVECTARDMEKVGIFDLCKGITTEYLRHVYRRYIS